MKDFGINLKIPEGKPINNKYLSQKLSTLDNYSESDNIFTFRSDPSIFFFRYNIKLHKQFSKKSIKLIVDFQPVINSVIGIILFSAFFARISVLIFIIVGLSFPVIFVLLNIFWIKIYMSGILRLNISEEELRVNIQNQKKWIKEPFKCSGCGTSLTKYDYKCPECGLFCKSKPNHSRFSSTSDRFTYKYVLKKTDTDFT